MQKPGKPSESLEICRGLRGLRRAPAPGIHNVHPIPALLSLAAECEELRGDLEKERTASEDLKKGLALAGKAFRRILKNPADVEAVRAEADGWQHSPTDGPTLMVQLEALESRYSALETAARKIQRDGAWVGAYVFGAHDQEPERFHVMKDDARALFDALAALTPEEGE